MFGLIWCCRHFQVPLIPPKYHDNLCSTEGQVASFVESRDRRYKCLHCFFTHFLSFSGLLLTKLLFLARDSRCLRGHFGHVGHVGRGPKPTKQSYHLPSNRNRSTFRFLTFRFLFIFLTLTGKSIGDIA